MIRPWAAVVQVAVVAAIVVIAYADLQSPEPVPSIVYGVLAGIGWAIEPETIRRIFRP